MQEQKSVAFANRIVFVGCLIGIPAMAAIKYEKQGGSRDMREAYDKREHSAKRNTDDLTDYQKLNSLGGAGVLVNPNEVPPLNVSEEDEESLPITPTTHAGDTDSVTVYNADYNDGVDFGIVDDEGKTNT